MMTRIDWYILAIAISLSLGLIANQLSRIADALNKINGDKG